jgi:hypothetical protein
MKPLVRWYLLPRAHRGRAQQPDEATDLDRRPRIAQTLQHFVQPRGAQAPPCRAPIAKPPCHRRSIDQALASLSTSSLEPMSSPTSDRSSGQGSTWPPTTADQANSRDLTASHHRPSSSRRAPSWCLREAPWEPPLPSAQASVWWSGELPPLWFPSPGGPCPSLPPSVSPNSRSGQPGRSPAKQEGLWRRGEQREQLPASLTSSNPPSFSDYPKPTYKRRFGSESHNKCSLHGGRLGCFKQESVRFPYLFCGIFVPVTSTIGSGENLEGSSTARRPAEAAGRRGR